MKTLRRVLLILAALVTFVVLFYAVEGLRGMSVWRKTKADLEAKGERFDWKSLTPPPVPDAENFALTPLFAPLFDVIPVPDAKPGTARFKLRDQAAHDRLTNLKFSGDNPPTQGIWRLAQTNDLVAWQDHYRGLTGFPTAPTAGQPGEDVLLALSKFAPEMTELRAAARRPHARFPNRYEDNFAMRLSHLSVVRRFSQIAALQATAQLSLGKSAAALDDIRLGFRLADAIATEPTLISSLMRIAMTETTLQPIWEGLAHRQWTEAQLLELEKLLAARDLLAAYPRAIRGEQVFGLAGIDLLRDNPRLAANLFVSGTSVPESMTLFLTPSGWFDQNKAFVVRFHQEFSLPMIDLEKRLFRFDVYERAKGAEGELHTRHPYRILGGMLLPAIVNVGQKFAQTQTALDLARVACALERHRFKHGTFPETTAALVPDFLAKLPHDIMSGEPLRYRRTADGNFVLYSVGFNQTDDGGEVAVTTDKPPHADFKHGDWVWRYPENPPAPVAK